MYKEYLQLRPSKAGVGVFTTVTIPAGVPIFEFKGENFTTSTLKHPPSRTLQIGPNTHLGPSGEMDDYVNHSCNPNCALHMVGNRAFLYSRFLIPANSEIAYDYSTSSTDTPEEWSMNCKCGSNNCRRVISGFQTLDKSLQDEYRKNGLVPLFLSNPIFLKIDG